MQQYSVDIFDRTLTYVFNEQTIINSIDDDYISPKTNSISVSSLPESVIAGYFILLKNDKTSFFGLITDISPGEYTTTIQFSSFITVFSDSVLYWVPQQGTETNHTTTLENSIRGVISGNYITNADTLARLPATIAIDPNITQIARWTLGIARARDGLNYATPSVYSNIIVPALKMYGVSIKVSPDFNAKKVNLLITKSTKTLNIKGDQDDIVVRTLKYNDRPLGVNKLTVVSGLNTNNTLTFYVHPDRTFDTVNSDRITPVAFETRIIFPKDNTTAEFQLSAIEEAYNVFSGSAWDNYIELEVGYDNKNINPMELEIGQQITLWYKGATYTSILTGKILEDSSAVLLFGSERVQYSKQIKGGR